MAKYPTHTMIIAIAIIYIKTAIMKPKSVRDISQTDTRLHAMTIMTTATVAYAEDQCALVKAIVVHAEK